MKKCTLKEHSVIVSCQALEDEPLYGSNIMARMAIAAKQGGASGIRANTLSDIKAIKEVIDLPVIGIVKREYEESDVYITPTMKEVDEVVSAKAEIVAIDATKRKRPNGCNVKEFVQEIKQKYPSLKIMADISTYAEGILAYEAGVDIVSTTLSGYTDYTKDVTLPNISLVKQLAEAIDIPIICEGGITDPSDVKKAFEAGAYATVIGSAITRPQLITKRFTRAAM